MFINQTLGHGVHRLIKNIAVIKIKNKYFDIRSLFCYLSETEVDVFLWKLNAAT